MNRRLSIFIVVFLAVCAAGFAYTYSIAPTYVGSAMLQIEPGAKPDQAQESAAFVANEAQALTSHELLERALSGVREKHPAYSAFTVPRLRETLSVSRSPESNVIELKARGSDREALAALLDAWITAYFQSRQVRRNVDRDAAIDDARAAVASIVRRVDQKRRELDDFRRRHQIVSVEREENEVAAQMRSLNAAIGDAKRKAIDAESRLSTLKASVADGKAVYRPQDKALLAQLEQRAADHRRQIADLERRFTPQYLAMDPRAKALTIGLQELERQLEATRASSRQEMLNEAAQEAVTAQKNVARLEAQLAERGKEALTFTSRFSEQRAQGAELAHLEGELVKARQRLAQLEQSERAWEPRYLLLGSPAVADKPVHPQYPLYAGYTLAGALGAALLAVLLVEFLSPRPKRDAPAYPQPIIQIAYPALAPGGTELHRVGRALPQQPQALPPVSSMPSYELTTAEVTALWGAATRDGRLAIAALFSGLTLPELTALTWDAIDFDSSSVRLAHPIHAVRPLTVPLSTELQARADEGPRSGPVAATAAGALLSVEDLAGWIAAAAHDAGLEHAQAVDADALRHTYVSYLVRQGARLAELEKIVGPVPPALFLHYRSLSPRGPGVASTALNRVFPAFA